ncbi:hypothetical protein SLEP1_g26634 [Rubroshorea leprosula]|uniref:Uncharacterized protein n=1 Tax=Rubroshorea leprosula TaxID=152421 RepID=A0AAV5JTS0_9ROSI|nr:hypothetical protein SLEP1_g26634 [Rubroshorea leprosula]
MLLSHAKAVKLYRERFQPKQGGAIGIITSSHMYEPLTDDELNQQAANRALDFYNRMISDNLIAEPKQIDYPSELRQYHGSELPRFSAEEVEYVEGSVEFIGINHYSTLHAKDCIYSACTSGGDHAIKGLEQTTGERDSIPIGEPTGIERFFVVPRGMEKIVTYVKQRYNNIPMYVTENGYSPWLEQREGKNDLLQDVKRIEFHKSYLAALAGAIRKGANVRGYFIWSLMDNLKWTEGYGLTFGLYHVDRQTVRRTPNLSAKWYKDFVTNSSDHNYIQEFNRELRMNPGFLVSIAKSKSNSFSYHMKHTTCTSQLLLKTIERAKENQEMLEMVTLVGELTMAVMGLWAVGLRPLIMRFAGEMVEVMGEAIHRILSGRPSFSLSTYLPYSGSFLDWP